MYATYLRIKSHLGNMNERAIGRGAALLAREVRLSADDAALVTDSANKHILMSEFKRFARGKY